MSKFIEPSEEIVKIVKELSKELGLEAYGLDIKPLCVPKATEVCKVVKANDLTEYEAKQDNRIYVLCYVDAFEGTDKSGHPLADEKTKYMWIRNAMEVISYDSEKDRVNLKCPMISIPLGFYEKYKEPTINSARLALYTMAQIADMKKEEAEAKRAEKKNKKRQ